jgi:hypothetical protein
MKRFILAVLLPLAISYSVLAQNEESAENLPDTLEEQTEDEGWDVIDFDIPFYSKIKHRHCDYELDLPFFGFGMIYADTDSPLDFNVSRSIEIQPFCFYASKSWRRSSLSAGLGILSRNFTQTGNTMLSVGDDGSIVAGPYPEGSSPKLSRLSVFSVIVPLQYSYNFGKGFGFSIGPVVDFNTKSVLKAKYSLDGSKQKDKYKFVHCNPVTVDIMLQIILDDLAVYVKYSPMDLMDDQWWPGMHQQVSFGIML